jgi:gliding motility-associated-like protein
VYKLLIITILSIFLCFSIYKVKAQNNEIRIYSVSDDRFPEAFDGGYTLDGRHMSISSRQKLLSKENFGQGGRYNKAITIIDKFTESGSLRSATVLPYNSIFFFGSFNLSWLAVSKRFTDSEIDSLYEWSRKGGKLIIANSGRYELSDFTYDSRILADKWGIGYQFQVPSPLIRTEAGKKTTIFDGPFGNLIGTNQGGDLQSYFSMIPDNSIVLATDFALNPTLIIDCNTLDLIIADVDSYTMVGTSFNSNDGVTTGPDIWNAQDVFWVNTIVFMDQLQGLPKIVHYQDSLMLAEKYNDYRWYRNGLHISSDPFISDMQAGEYTVDVTTNGGCIVTSEVFDVKCPSLPRVDLGSDTTLCRNVNFILSASSIGSTYLWQDHSTDSIYSVKQSGLYWVQVSNACGATIDSIFVQVTPQLNLGKDTTICQSGIFVLNSGIQNADHLWSDGSKGESLLAQSSGLYWVEVSDSCGIHRDSINIKIDNEIKLNLGPDTTLCFGDLLILDAFADNAYYSWQDGSTNATYQVTEAGTYWVRVTNSCGARNEFISVKYFDELELGPDQELCEGSGILLDATMKNATYLWSDGSTSPTFKITESGKYSVQVDHTYCPMQIDEIIVKTKPRPSLKIGNERISCSQDSYTIDVTLPNATYLWNDGFTGSLYTVTEDGFYFVTITVDGCSTIERVDVSKESCPGHLILPNVFTPNNDGINDEFIPQEMSNIVSMNTKIFERSGNLIFETNNLSIDWNGETKNEKKLSSGTYYYLITYIDLTQKEVELQGLISIVY